MLIYTTLLALIAAASFCEAQRSKRYSGKQETAPEKFKQETRLNGRKRMLEAGCFLKIN
jgi:hypothetical protein